ncbi:MAG: cytochrome c maturation protein CcmE [Pseudomonadota bacterium]
MKTQRRQRLWVVTAIVLLSGAAVGLALVALQDNVNFFYSPAQIVAGEAPLGRELRGGGMVKAGSVLRSDESLAVTFVISDMNGSDVTVQYEGILPDLFREGQGIVAIGQLDERLVLHASEVLAKHDENYMPPEVADVIDEAHLRSSEPTNFQPL